MKAYDANGKFLRKSLGFLWDEATVICSFSGVKDASVIEVKTDGSRNSMNRLMTYNAAFDLAVLKTEEEFQETPVLGSSNLVAAGDRIHYFSRQQDRWLRVDASVKDWVDSGQGYQFMRLAVPQQNVFEPSPVYNAQDKVVGWINRGGTAIPLEAIDALVSERNVSVPLDDFKRRSDSWMPRKRTMKGSIAKTWKQPEMTEKTGTSRFPYTCVVPKGWDHQESSQGDRYLFRSFDEASGINIELRIFPSSGGDMMSTIEEAEARIFTGVSRASLVPYSAQGFTGFMANYDDLEAAYITSVFYTMFRKNVYALSVAFPQKLEQQINPLLDQVLSSLRP
ncbi:MAG TPA: hypothetical protein VJ521_06985 [Acidobacteriota bacterium]|nr:hypothetical protein [Acidobacteriota bacterium]